MVTGRPELDALILDFLRWIEERPRPYSEVMDAWRTSCPRLPVWEAAIERGLVQRMRSADGPVIVLTDAGRAFCAEARHRGA